METIRSRLEAGCNVRIESGTIINGEDVPEKVLLTHNLVVDTGLNQISLDGMQNFDIIKYGSGDTAPAADDTDLEAEEYDEELTVDPSTDTQEGMAIVTYYHYLGSAAGSLGSITEAGLFLGEVMIARVTFEAISKTAGTYIKVIWSFALTAEELA